MAFPAIRGTPTTGNSGGNASSVTVTLPATVEADDIIVIVVGSDGTGTTLTADGYTGYPAAGPLTTSASSMRVLWKRSTDGSEDGASVTVTHGATESTGWVAAVISGGHTTSAPEFSTGTSESAVAVPPADLTPTWGSDDTLWIAAAAWDGNHTATVATGAGSLAFTAANTTWWGYGAVAASTGAGAAAQSAPYAAATMYAPATTPYWLEPNTNTGDQVASIGIAIRPAAVTEASVPSPLRIYPQLLAH